MSIEQEIRNEIDNIKQLKIDVGDINNHLSILEGLCRERNQKAVENAYQRGLHEGNDIGYKDGVNDGQNDAWEAARKIAISPGDGGLSTHDLFKIFGNDSLQYAFKNYSASEAIAKLKAYEEKQKADEEIKVGDEVIYNGTTKCIVVRPEDDERYASLIDSDGTLYSADHRECKKTGRHFDIDKILAEMRT